MTTQRQFEPHPFAAYTEASEICRHCNRGRYASIHESTTLTPLQAENQRRSDWCDDCHGYTHMPWCSEYEEPEVWISHFDSRHRKGEPCNQCASHEQPASATGSETWKYREGSGVIYAETVPVKIIARYVDADVAQRIINNHNHCGTQLRFLGNRAEELSSLLAGMTTERDDTAALAAKAGAMVTRLTEQNERLREALRFQKDALHDLCDDSETMTSLPPIVHAKIANMRDDVDAALNHAKQGEGS